MNKAHPCRNCKTDTALQWKHYDYQQWWIHCDKYGNIGKAGLSRAEAGHNWNMENQP